MYFFTLFVFVLTSLIQALFLESLLQVKYRGLIPVISVLTSSLFPIWIKLGWFEISQPSFIRVTMVILPIALCCIFLCYDKLLTKIFLLSLSFVLQLLPEILVAFPFVFIFKSLGVFHENDLIGYSPIFVPIQICHLLCQQLLSFFTASFIRKRQSGIKEQWFSQFFLFLATQFFMFFMFTYIFTRSAGSVSTIRLSTVILCIATGLFTIIANLCIYLILVRLSEKERLRYQAEFYAKQLSLQLEHLQEFSFYDETLHRARHDLRNQLATLQALMKRCEFPAAMTLTGQLQQSVADLQIISCCENHFISAIVFSKYKEMKKFGIAFTYDLNIPETVSIPETELYNCFNNALDQAIDACRDKKGAAAIHLECQASDVLHPKCYLTP